MRLRVLKCRHCGGRVQLAEGAESAKCGQCGTNATLDEAIREQADRARRFPNPTPLRLGMKALIRGREYELIGRIAYREKEEGETFRWDEFELIAPDGDCLFLEYEDGQWKLMESFVPETPIGPQETAGLNEGASVTLDGHRAVVSDQGQGEIVAVEGELTFAARAGDRRHYLDARYLNRHYVIEWGEEEIEFYRGQPWSARQVLAAFGLKEQLSALDALEYKRRSQRLFANVCLLACFAGLLAWGIASGSGTVIRRWEVRIDQVTDKGVQSPLMALDPAQRVHRLAIFGSMSQASAWVAGVLATAGGQELLGTQRTFWDESGRDEDGYWHESDLRAQTDFRVQRPGNYRIHLYVDPDPLPYRGSFGSAGFELRGGALYPTYFLTYAIAMGLLSLLFYFVGGREKLKAMAESSD